MNGMEIRIARLKSGMRQYELADRLGVRDSDLSMIETGRKTVPPALIPKLQETLAEHPDAPLVNRVLAST